MSKGNFFDSPLYTITNYIYYFLMTNLIFVFTNILFFILLLFGTPGFLTYLLLFITAIPLGPSFAAILSVMHKLLRQKELSVAKDYFSAFKQNFKQAIKIWLFQLVAVTVLLVDLNSTHQNAGFAILYPFFLVAFALVVLLGLHAFPILTRFYMKTTDIIKTSFYFTIRKFNITILNLSIIVVVFFLIKYLKMIGILFFASVIAYLIMFYEKDILAQLEEKINSNSDNTK
ncbi:DUF624 domain-containing protein [Clostridium sp. 19966]|uniref:YesL family protein n=1 Tax=Clostridium sp. 19966 TaxID=2768166 RepID=UPI0028DFFA81|nr:DUF624 domain-containing protein [Clostridium sp. 19966]MDT8715669.1 DUF624 domain-containing protein [Clostridium sp. 19966]